MREFKFFHGIKRYKLTAVFEPELDYNINLYDDVINSLTEEMRLAFDEEYIRILTRRINGGGQNSEFEGPIQRFNNNNINYLNHFIGMGGGNRA